MSMTAVAPTPTRTSSIFRLWSRQETYWNGLTLTQQADCVGDCLNRSYKGRSGWEVKGCLRDVWHDDLHPMLKTICNSKEGCAYIHRKKHYHETATFDLFLLSLTRLSANAKPTVVTTCQNIRIAERTIHIIQKHDGVKEFGLDFLAVEDRIRLRAGEGTTRGIPPFLDFPSTCGSKLLVSRWPITRESKFKRATFGGVLVLDGRYYALTAAHPFYGDFEDDIPDSDSSQSEELSNDDEESSSERPEQYHTLPPKHGVYLEPPQTEQQQDPTRPSDGQAHWVQSSMPSLIGHLVPSVDTIEYDANGSAPDSKWICLKYDWALVEIQDSRFMQPNVIRTGLATHVKALFEWENSLPQGKVIVAVEGREITHGVMGSTISGMTFPWSNQVQDVWRVQCKTTPGASGAWVVSAETGSIFGMIVAGCDDTDLAYMVPAVDILKSIVARWEGQVEFFSDLSPSEPTDTAWQLVARDFNRAPVEESAKADEELEVGMRSMYDSAYGGGSTASHLLERDRGSVRSKYNSAYAGSSTRSHLLERLPATQANRPIAGPVQDTGVERIKTQAQGAHRHKVSTLSKSEEATTVTSESALSKPQAEKRDEASTELSRIPRFSSVVTTGRYLLTPGEHPSDRLPRNTTGEHPSDRLPRNTSAQADVGPRTSAGSVSGRHAPHLQQLGPELESGRSADNPRPAAPEARATFLSPLERSFALIKPNDFRQCRTFIADKPAIIQVDHHLFINEAIQTYSQNNKLFARSCVQRALMIESCRNMSKQGIREYLQDLINNRREALQDFFGKFDRPYSEVQRLGAEGQQRHDVASPNFGATTPQAKAPSTSQKNRSDYGPSHQITGQRSMAAGDLGLGQQVWQHQRSYSKGGQTGDRPSFTPSMLLSMRETQRSHPMAAQHDPNPSSLQYAAAPHIHRERKHSMADQTGIKADHSEYANVTPMDGRRAHAVAGVIDVVRNSSQFTGAATRPSQRSHEMAGQTGSDPYFSRQNNLSPRSDQKSHAMAGQGYQNSSSSPDMTSPMDAKQGPNIGHGESGGALSLPYQIPSIMRPTQRSHSMATEPAASMQGSTKAPEQVPVDLAKMNISPVRPPGSNTLGDTSPEAASAKLSRVSSHGSQPAAPTSKQRKNMYPTLKGNPAEIKPTEGEAELLDPRYKKQKAGGQFFIPGCVFAMLWHENATNTAKTAEDLGPAVHKTVTVYKGTKGRYGETIFTHIRRLIVIKQRHGYSWCVPINTYGRKGLTVKKFNNEDIRAHAIVYRNGGEVPKALAGEEEMKKGPIAVDMIGDHELATTSRVFISKVQSVDWNVKVMPIGSLTDKSLSFLDGYFRSIFDEH